MYIGKVIGSVVSTVKISHLEGRTLLLVDQLDLGGKETGAYDIAVDTVQAGPGDTVLVMVSPRPALPAAPAPRSRASGSPLPPAPRRSPASP
jgi:microcompartment protein CcmK/EutM